MPGDMYRFVIELPKEDIFYVSWTVDSYEGVGIIRTVDENRAVIEFYTTFSWKEDAYALIRALKEEGVDLKVLEEGEADFR